MYCQQVPITAPDYQLIKQRKKEQTLQLQHASNYFQGWTRNEGNATRARPSQVSARRNFSRIRVSRRARVFCFLLEQTWEKSLRPVSLMIYLSVAAPMYLT